MRIQISNQIPEGEHVFKIIDANVTFSDFYEDEDTHEPKIERIDVNLVTSTGMKHTETFRFIDKIGNENDSARWAFGYFAKVALNDFSLNDIDEKDLIGHYVRATVKYNQSVSQKTGKTLTFVNLEDKSPADASEFGDAPRAEPAKEPEGKTEAPAFSGLMGMLK